jgi:ABC-type multidrug transport system fused ATPase/permease subunit
VVLDEGRIAAQGTAEELRQSSPVYREIEEHGLLAAVPVVPEALEASA